MCLDEDFGDLEGDDSSDGSYCEIVKGDFDDDDILMSEFVVEEDEIQVEDYCNEMTFEDFLDGSTTFDRVYENGKIWVESPFGSIKLEEWLIFPTNALFLEVITDLYPRGACNNCRKG